MRRCKHDIPQCGPVGEAFVMGRDCRICWLYVNNAEYRRAWSSGEEPENILIPDRNVGIVLTVPKASVSRPHKPGDKGWSCIYLGRRSRRVSKTGGSVVKQVLG